MSPGTETTSRRRLQACAALTVALGLAVWAGVSGAAAPAGRYAIVTTGVPSGGTVYDNETGLTWQRTVPATRYTADGARTYCTGLGSGWRVPSVKEFQTIVDETLPASALHIDTGAFQSVPTSEDFFWTSSSLASNGAEGWVFGFSGCASGSCHSTKTSSWRVLCVR